MTTCPACNSTAVVNAGRFSLTADEAAHQFILKEADPVRHAQLARHIATLWSNSSCEMVECNECGLGFANPFVAGDATFYNLAAHADYPTDKWEFSITANALAGLNTSEKYGLEIGSGYGNFLKQISPRYFKPSQLLAIEYNQAAGKRLTDAGFKVEARDVRSDTFREYQGKFSFVFLFQVLEHMDGLESLAERLRLLTTEQAHIFIAVPNPTCIRFNERNGSLIDAPPNHISLWTKKSFERFGKQLGCELANFQIEPMSWIDFLRQDLTYSHMRRAQQHGTLANALRSRRRTKLRRLTEAAVAFAWAPTRIPCWLRAHRERQNLGGSIWAHLKKV